MKTIFLLITFSALSLVSTAQRVNDFRIKISNDSVFISNNIEEPYVVLLFLAKECPFDKAYKNRINSLRASFSHHRFISIGNVQLQNIQSFPSNKGLQYEFGIEKTPTAVVLRNLANGFSMIYKGPIDDNAQLPNKVKEHYLQNVLQNPSKQTKTYYIPGCTLH